MAITRLTLLAAAAVVAGTAAATPAAAQDMASPQLLASNCFNCHGWLGRSVGIIDDLAALPARRITKHMLNFKADEKPATIMGRIAKGYTDSEIKAIAEYIENANTVR